MIDPPSNDRLTGDQKIAFTVVYETLGFLFSYMCVCVCVWACYFIKTASFECHLLAVFRSFNTTKTGMGGGVCFDVIILLPRWAFVVMTVCVRVCVSMPECMCACALVYAAHGAPGLRYLYLIAPLTTRQYMSWH